MQDGVEPEELNTGIKGGVWWGKGRTWQYVEHSENRKMRVILWPLSAKGGTYTATGEK